jgi:adenylate cyclase
MGTEIERKFLVRDLSCIAGRQGVAYRQGFLCSGSGVTVRVRAGGDKAYLTVKGPATGIARSEYEYPIPPADAAQILGTLCTGGMVEKTRYRVPHGGLVWEIDVFVGDNAGLVIAEVELPAEDHPVSLPPWVGAEVSADRRYSNAALAHMPFKRW